MSTRKLSELVLAKLEGKLVSESNLPNSNDPELKLGFDERIALIKKVLQASVRKAKASGGQVELEFIVSGETIKGRYNGLMNQGGYSYAKMEDLSNGTKGMMIVPLPMITNVSIVNTQTKA